MCELLDKNGKRKKKKRITTDHKKGEKLARCVAVSFGKAE